MILHWATFIAVLGRSMRHTGSDVPPTPLAGSFPVAFAPAMPAAWMLFLRCPHSSLLHLLQVSKVTSARPP